MSFFSMMKWIIIGALSIGIIRAIYYQTRMSRYKKLYLQSLQKKSKVDSITYGRIYFEAYNRMNTGSSRITDIETRIANDLNMHNIN